MKRLTILVPCFFLVAFLFTPAGSAGLYRWTDSSGTTHLSDNPANVPSAYRNSAKVITEPVEIGGGRIIPFERTASGHILVDVTINGVKAKMVVDTGASNVVITEALARRLNLDLSQAAEVIKLHTNCGDIEGRSFVIGKIELGDSRKENVRSVIAPNDSIFMGFDGLLGLSFLGDFKITVDYKNGQIILGR